MPRKKPAFSCSSSPRSTANPLRQGIYARILHAEEIEDLRDQPLTCELDEDLLFIRVLIRRILKFLAEEPNNTIDDLAKALNVCSGASNRRASILRAKALLARGGSDVSQAVSDAIEKVARELEEKNDPGPSN